MVRRVTVAQRRAALRLADGGLVSSSVAAGVGGTLAMTVSSTLEMRLRDRAPSSAPGDAVQRIIGRELPERVRRVAGNAAHVTTGLALGVPRTLIARADVGEPMATALFVPIASVPDVVVVPALGVTAPPWRWGAREFAISMIHHVAYAVGASVGLSVASHWSPG